MKCIAKPIVPFMFDFHYQRQWRAAEHLLHMG